MKDQKNLVKLAIEGDRHSLESLIKSVQDKIYHLSLKMLYLPPEAEDATQEILIKIVTKLDSFKQKSSFNTWAFRIASNHLLNKRKSIVRKEYTFKSCKDSILHEITR